MFAQEFTDFLSGIGLIQDCSIEFIQDQNRHGRGTHGRCGSRFCDISPGVLLNRRGGVLIWRLERRNCLLPAVLKNREIILREIADWLAVLVCHDHVQNYEPRRRMQRWDRSFLLRSGCLLCTTAQSQKHEQNPGNCAPGNRMPEFHSFSPDLERTHKCLPRRNCERHWGSAKTQDPCWCLVARIVPRTAFRQLRDGRTSGRSEPARQIQIFPQNLWASPVTSSRLGQVPAIHV